MNQEFIKLADSIKSQLENRFSKEQLRNNYIYDTLIELISEYNSGKFMSKKTDIGTAAVKIFDSNNDEDNKLVTDLGELAKLYKMGR